MRINPDALLEKLSAPLRRRLRLRGADHDLTRTTMSHHTEQKRSDRAPESVGAMHPARHEQSSIEPLVDDMLRHAIDAHARGRTEDVELGVAVRRLCDAAHSRNARAEAVLILVKSRWRALPEARRAAREQPDDMFAGVITLCIREYYARP